MSGTGALALGRGLPHCDAALQGVCVCGEDAGFGEDAAEDGDGVGVGAVHPVEGHAARAEGLGPGIRRV